MVLVGVRLPHIFQNLKHFIMCKDNLGVPAPQNQLLTETAQFTANANATTTGTYTLTSGRGDVKRMSVSTPTTVLADLAGISLTVAINSVAVIQNASLDQFSGLYNSLRSFLVNYPQASVVTFTAVNSTGTPVEININFDYVLFQ